jgi:hypothetical protein
MKTPPVASSATWIACADEMPPDDTYVLTAGKCHGVLLVAAWDPKREGWCDYQGDNDCGCNVITHWAPLPEGPIEALREEPKATPAGMSASLTPEGHRVPVYPNALDAMDWLQVHQAAAGVGSGSVMEWPRLRDALRKLIGLPAVSPFPSGKSVPPPTTSGSPS